MGGLGAVLVLLLGALVIAKTGIALAKVSSQLAARTGLGEAFFGAVLLGGATSLPGVVTSASAAAAGYPQLALANALGGIAAQTTFLALADIAHRRANLEHAAASLANIVSGVVLIALLTAVLCVTALPPLDVFGVHPGSLLIVGGYVAGMNLVREARRSPNWRPRWTAETQKEEGPPVEHVTHSESLRRAWMRFLVLALVVAVAGHVVARTGIALVEAAGVSETVAGAYLTAIVTSLPELVTAVAAVKHGALRLAVGDIMGGNCFDVLFVVVADIAYRPGSIFHATDPPVFLVSLSIFLASIIILGLLQREKHGIANIGFESVVVLVVYLVAALHMTAR